MFAFEWILTGVALWIAISIAIAALMVIKPFHVKQRRGGGFS